jgi:hypothetical protein
MSLTTTQQTAYDPITGQAQQATATGLPAAVANQPQDFSSFFSGLAKNYESKGLGPNTEHLFKEQISNVGRRLEDQSALKALENLYKVNPTAKQFTDPTAARDALFRLSNQGAKLGGDKAAQPAPTQTNTLALQSPQIPPPPTGTIVSPQSEYAPPTSSDGQWVYSGGQWWPNETVSVGLPEEPQATALTAGTTTPITFTPGLANMSAIDKALEYNKLISSGATDPQIRAAADSAFGTQSAEDWQYLTGLAAQNKFTPGLANMSELDKALEYNKLISGGASDSQIKSAADSTFGTQSAEDWKYLNNLSGIVDLYQDVLGRAPDAGGLGNWYQQFGSEISPEERAQFEAAAVAEKNSRVNDLYKTYLGRDAEDEGLAFWRDKFGSSIDDSERESFRQSATNEINQKFGVTGNVTAPTTEGVLSGFKYANDAGISEDTLKRTLGEDVFNTYKAGFADYAKTGIANILADGQLSFDEARTAVKFGRDYGYDAQKLADLTGTDKEVFDAIYKNYDDTTDRIVGGVLGAEDVKTDADRAARAYLLQNEFGFTDEDLARATNYDAKKLKADLEPVRNFTSNYESLTKSTDSTLQDRKKFLEDARSNGAISQLYGEGLNNLDAQITELENKWNSYGDVDPYHAERIFRELAPQREALGDKYYQGRFADPMRIAATLASKGIDTVADIGQKDKFQTTQATRAQYTDGEKWGNWATEGDGENSYSVFVPLTAEEQATLNEDGTYQKKLGTVAIDKDTGKEIAGLDGTIASEKSGEFYNRKRNELNVGFTDGGVPVLYATKEKTGFGAVLQQALPLISFALPFMLPGLGAGLSGLLPGAGVAASGAAAAVAPTLMNQALTQGILSGGLSTLGGGKFEKGFLSGAVSPLISTGISNLLPAGMDKNAARAITGAGTGVVKGAMQDSKFEDLLQAGILSGATNYGLNTALQGSGLTPQQLNFATGIALPLLQGEKVNPLKVVSTLANYQSSQP